MQPRSKERLRAADLGCSVSSGLKMPHEEWVQVIENWMLTISQDGGIERYDDLHIDIIDPLWRPKPAWMNGGLDAFHAAIKLRDTHKLPFTVGLGLSLDTGGDIGQGGSVSTSDLQVRLNWTPPSLYLFHPGQEPGKDSHRAIQEGVIDADAISARLIFANAATVSDCYYLKFRRVSSDDYTQSVFLLG
jgi:hypothetical protein